MMVVEGSCGICRKEGRGRLTGFISMITMMMMVDAVLFNIRIGLFTSYTSK